MIKNLSKTNPAAFLKILDENPELMQLAVDLKVPIDKIRFNGWVLEIITPIRKRLTRDWVGW